MSMETVTITKKEEMSKQEIVNSDLYKQLVQSIEDLKTGKMRRVR